MGNTRISRFDFNSLRDFRGPIVINTAQEFIAEAAPVAPPPPVFSEADLDSARLVGKKQGYNEGFTAGQQEMQKSLDSRIEQANEVIANLAAIVGDMQAKYKQLLTDEAQQLSQLILSISRKVAGDALNERGEEVVKQVLTQCLPVIFSKPRVVIELNPELFDSTIGRIESQLHAYGFEGEVQFKGNPEFGMSDITIDWGSGQVVRNTETIWTEIEALIERVPLELTFADTLNTTDTTGA